MLDVASFDVRNDNAATSIAFDVDPSIDTACFTVSDPILVVSQVARKNNTPVISLVDVTCVDISRADNVSTFHGNADISSLVGFTNIDDIIANVAVNDNTNIHIFGDACTDKTTVYIKDVAGDDTGCDDVRDTIRIIAVTCIDAGDASAYTSDNVISVNYLTQHNSTVSDNTTIIIIAVTCIDADDASADVAGNDAITFIFRDAILSFTAEYASIVVSQNGTTTIFIIDVTCVVDSFLPWT